MTKTSFWCCVLGADRFALVDWRQAKHGTLIVPILAVFVAAWWAGLSGRLHRERIAFPRARLERYQHCVTHI